MGFRRTRCRVGNMVSNLKAAFTPCGLKEDNRIPIAYSTHQSFRQEACKSIRELRTPDVLEPNSNMTIKGTSGTYYSDDSEPEYVSHCYRCETELYSNMARCTCCGWIRCPNCGACGAGFAVGVKPAWRCPACRWALVGGIEAVITRREAPKTINSSPRRGNYVQALLLVWKCDEARDFFRKALSAIHMAVTTILVAANTGDGLGP